MDSDLFRELFSIEVIKPLIMRWINISAAKLISNLVAVKKNLQAMSVFHVIK